MNKTITEIVPPTVMVGIDRLRYASEAPPELNLQVRKSSDKVGLAELEASIRIHGIIVPLVTVEHKSVLYVSAGNRRLKLMRKIHGDKSAREVATVDSANIKGDAREIAMATNLGLPPHPVDRYEVIALLVKEGMTPADAQAHFALSKVAFNQVMRLGKMAPVIRNDWREGQIDASVVKAFALSDDPKEQERVYKLLKKNSHQGKVYPHDVASRFVGQQREAGQLVEFVGLAECEKAKLVVNTDLFGTNHTVGDLSLLKRLAAGKLRSACDKLVADGWAWALPADEIKEDWLYGSIEPAGKNEPTKPELARIDELAEALRPDNDDDTLDIEALESEQTMLLESIKARAYTPTQRAKGGCILKIGTVGNQAGRLIIQYGRTKPEDRKKVEAAERRAAPPDPNKKKAPKTDVKSAAMAQRLSEQLTRAAGMAIVREPSIAISALIAGFASRDHAVGVSISGDTSRGADFVKTFDGNLAGSTQNREMLLAQICGRALSFGNSNNEMVPLKNPAAAAICNAINPQKMNAALRECFDAKDYFSSTDKASVAQAVREAMGEDHAAAVMKMKGPEAAKFATANVPPTKWLPPWLRTAHYDGPKASKKSTTMRKVQAATAARVAKGKGKKKIAKKAKRK